MSDSSGKLYNKDSIIEFLLPADGDAAAQLKKTQAEEILQGAVKGLKDVVEVKLELDEEANKAARLGGVTDVAEMWKCPVTNKALGPGSKAVYLVPCGHAFAGSVIKEVDEEKCLQVWMADPSF